MTNTEECIAAGLDEKEVARITRGFERYLKQADELGIQVFGGGGCLSLRFDDNKGLGHLVVADCQGGNVEGGCGAEKNYGDGLTRGE